MQPKKQNRNYNPLTTKEKEDIKSTTYQHMKTEFQFANWDSVFCMSYEVKFMVA